MTEADVVAYLLRWLLEFGPEPVPPRTRIGNEWYMRIGNDWCMQGGHLSPHIEKYRSFDSTTECSYITDEGFDLLRRYHESNH